MFLDSSKTRYKLVLKLLHANFITLFRISLNLFEIFRRLSYLKFFIDILAVWSNSDLQI